MVACFISVDRVKHVKAFVDTVNPCRCNVSSILIISLVIPFHNYVHKAYCHQSLIVVLFLVFFRSMTFYTSLERL